MKSTFIRAISTGTVATGMGAPQGGGIATLITNPRGTVHNRRSPKSLKVNT